MQVHFNEIHLQTINFRTINPVFTIKKTINTLRRKRQDAAIQIKATRCITARYSFKNKKLVLVSL
jgi:hypothetical protein